MLKLMIGFVAVMALLSAACGGSDSNTAANPGAASTGAAGAGVTSRDACSLITTDEAAKILGSAVTATSRSVSSERSVCDYVTQAFESFTLEATWKDGDEAIKMARTGASAATAAAGGKQDQVVSEVLGHQRVDSLGDEAYFSRRGTSLVRKGDAVLGFQGAGLNEPAREHWEALARAALARL